MMMQSLNRDLLHWTVSPWEYAPHWPSTNNYRTNVNNNSADITLKVNENGTKNKQNTFEYGDQRIQTSEQSIIPTYVINKSKNNSDYK